MQFSADLTVRNGKITEAKIKFGGSFDGKEEEMNQKLLNRTLHEVHDWQNVLGSEVEQNEAVDWMNIMLGVPEDEKIRNSTES